ncbi:MAG TPA: LysR family transcriptional regulator [Chromatiales bacterium]|nr:LysR family transcriptional regulator [Chromatiales bacterium]
MHITLRQLLVFQTVAEHLSVSRAAESLFLSQPAVSMQLKKLTESVGMPLIEQVGKQLYLTPAGTVLYKSSREISETLERLEMAIDDMQGLKKGRLRLAVVTTIEYFAPRVLGAFCERFPGIEVELEVTNRKRLLERLAANRDDLYILGKPPEGIEVEAHPFMPNPLVVMAPRNHPLAGERHIPLDRLLEEPFIMREPGSGTRKAAERLFSAHQLSPKVRLELGSNEAIKQAVAGGLGVAILSRHTLSLEGDEGPLTILDVEGFPLERQWYLVYPKGKQLSVAAQSFFDHLVAIAPAASVRNSTGNEEANFKGVFDG